MERVVELSERCVEGLNDVTGDGGKVIELGE